VDIVLYSDLSKESVNPDKMLPPFCLQDGSKRIWGEAMLRCLWPTVPVASCS
jgi:hypothetical protein